MDTVKHTSYQNLSIMEFQGESVNVALKYALAGYLPSTSPISVAETSAGSASPDIRLMFASCTSALMSHLSLPKSDAHNMPQAYFHIQGFKCQI